MENINSVQKPKLKRLHHAKKHSKVKIYVALVVLVAVTLLTVLLALVIKEYIDTHDFKVRNMIIFKVQNPIVIERKKDLFVAPVKKEIQVITPTPTEKPKKRTLVPVVYASEISGEQMTDQQIADYIKSKDWDYSTAIRLAKSENFWNLTHSFDCKRKGAMNSNGTYDHGLWQINDIHIKSGAITLEDANDCKKATDFAYGLYKAHHGFTPWSAYNNGSYKNHSEEI